MPNVLQIQNLERSFCRPAGHTRLTTCTPTQHDCMTLSNRFYTTSLTDSGKFAAKNNGEAGEETSLTIY